MTEQVSMLATMPVDVSSFPGIQTVEGETQPRKLFSDLHRCKMLLPHPNTHTRINVKFNV